MRSQIYINGIAPSHQNSSISFVGSYRSDRWDGEIYGVPLFCHLNTLAGNDTSTNCSFIYNPL